MPTDAYTFLKKDPVMAKLIEVTAPRDLNARPEPIARLNSAV